MTWAVIDGGVVVNLIVWDGETDWSPGAGLTVVSAEPGVAIGWTWDGERFAPPPAA